MDLERQQIDVFLEKCDDVMRSKFIIADTKISELLKSIATSDLLVSPFSGRSQRISITRRRSAST